MGTPTIHRYWEGEPSSVAELIGMAVRNMHPESIVKEWTVDEVADIPVDVSQVRPVDEVRHRSNIIRYWLLHEYGGLWLDSDVVPLDNLFGSVPHEIWTAELRGRREGCALAFPAGHPFLAEALASIAAAGPSDLVSADVSGARLLDRCNGDGVGREPRVIPVDALGRHVPSGAPAIAVHLWQTAAKRNVAVEELAAAEAKARREAGPSGYGGFHERVPRHDQPSRPAPQRGEGVAGQPAYGGADRARRSRPGGAVVD
jgi:hypothetical protein